MVVIIRLDRIIQFFSLDCPIKLGNDKTNDIKYLQDVGKLMAQFFHNICIVLNALFGLK